MTGRRFLGLALLVSVGVNIGVVAALAAGYWSQRTAGETVSAPLPADGPESSPGVVVDPDREAERDWFRRASGPLRQRVERLADGVGLEGEARERFIDLQGNFLETSWTGRRRVAELQHGLREELASPAPDPERVRVLVDELARARRGLDESLARTVLESRALLAVESPGSEARYLEFLKRLQSGPREGRRGRLERHVPRRPLRP